MTSAATFGPYSAIRQAGNVFYISGQIGVHPDTKTAPLDIRRQTERALLNMESVLQKQNLTLNDVVKTTVFLTSMDNFTAMNEVYESRFDTPRPARSTVAVKELPRVAGAIEILIEIEAVARVKHQ
jgi:2-iminobutanoate/2-iminopropanoate deaminase